MNRSIGFIIGLSIVGVFILVYGTSLILRLLLGDYLFVVGLMDLNYTLLAILCSVPFVLYLLLRGKPILRAIEVVLSSGILFITLFIYVQFALVTMTEEMTQGLFLRIITIIPTTAIILILVSHFATSNKKLIKVH